jgi:hypothetical protein
MTPDELAAEVSGAVAKGISKACLGAVTGHYKRLHPGEVETLARELQELFPGARDGDEIMSRNAAELVNRRALERPVSTTPATAYTGPLCDWPQRPALPIMQAVFNGGPPGPPLPSVMDQQFQRERAEQAARGWAEIGLRAARRGKQ